MKIETLSLFYLKYFFDTVETGSLTKAANLNYVTRPAISLAINRLEEWAGKSLVTHQRKIFSLTKDGEAFYRQTKASYVTFKNSLEQGEATFGGRLKIGCSASLFDKFLLPGLQKLKASPEPQIKLGTTSQLKSLIEQDEINIAIYIDDGIPSGLPKIKALKGQFILASKTGQFSKTLITTEVRPEILSLQKVFSKRRSKMNYHIKAESWTLCMKLAKALDGTCLIPDCTLDSSLRKVAFPAFRESYEVIIAHRKKEFLSLSEIQLLDDLVKSQK